MPNLMAGFGIDELQAEYVAEIKLRHLNREYILKRTEEIENLEKEIAELEGVLASKAKIKKIIEKELAEVGKRFGQPRKSILIYADEIQTAEEEEEAPDYSVNIFYTKEGYFKKILPQSLRMSSEQKLKEGDSVAYSNECSNNDELLFFTDKAQVYKTKVNEFKETKASTLGDYVPAKLNMDEGENSIYAVNTKDYKGYMIFAFENGKVAKVPLSAYETKTNRKKLTGAYSDKSPIADIIYVKEDCEIMLTSSQGRVLLFNTGAIAEKASRSTIGVNVLALKKGHRLISAKLYKEGDLAKPSRYRTKTLPAAGSVLSAEDKAEQLSFL